MAEKKPKEKEADVNVYEALNIYQKLILARKLFFEGDVEKTGKNMAIEFKYFELKDIVPAATKIFYKIGLVAIVKYTEEEAEMLLINTDKPDEVISFVTPMRYPAENRGTNAVQALGSAHTYLRRYLYMMVLDVCEPDTIDGLPAPKEEPKKEEKKNNKPATPAERAEIKKEITNTAEQADELQKKGLIEALNLLLDADPDQEEWVQELALKTNSFTDLTREECEKLINGIGDILKQYEEAK